MGTSIKSLAARISIGVEGDVGKSQFITTTKMTSGRAVANMVKNICQEWPFESRRALIQTLPEASTAMARNKMSVRRQTMQAITNKMIIQVRFPRISEVDLPNPVIESGTVGISRMVCNKTPARKKRVKRR